MPQSWDDSSQYDVPTPDSVGILFTTQAARRFVAGYLIRAGNAYRDGTGDNQAYLLWLGKQIASLKSLSVVVTVLGDGATPNATVDADGVLQIGVPPGATGDSWTIEVS